MKQLRATNGYWKESLPAPFHRNVVTTSGSIKDELLASIQLYSDVKAYGSELLKKNGHTSVTDRLSQLRAYVSQARTFYDAADLLHYRASALLYYYSFMNFAKALVLVKDLKFKDQNLKHGLSHRSAPGRLRSQSVSANGDGVFQHFYAAVARHPLRCPAKLKILNLLGYVSDVGNEYQQLKFGEGRSVRGRLAIGRTPKSEVFGIIALQHTLAPKLYPEIEKSCLRGFDEVTYNPNIMKAMLDISQEMNTFWRFYETKNVFPWQGDWSAVLASHLTNLFGSNLAFIPVESFFLFYLNAKIRTPRAESMNEILAIYCLMFFLGSLVRYQPHYLETLLQTKDGWIIERFLKQAPITFLRLFRNAFDDTFMGYKPN